MPPSAPPPRPPSSPAPSAPRPQSSPGGQPQGSQQPRPQQQPSAAPQSPTTLDWPDAKPVATPTPQDESPITGKGLLGDKDKAEGEKSGNKIIVKKKAKITCFEDFDALDGKEEGKPVLLFVYWPDRTDSKGKSSKAYVYCQKFIELLGQPDVQTALSLVDRYKVDFKSLDKERKKRYRIKGAPTLLFIDATGKVLKRLTSWRIKPKILARLIQTVAKTSDKNLKKLQKKREKENK